MLPAWMQAVVRELPGCGAQADDSDQQTLLFWYPAVTATPGDYIRAAISRAT